MLLAWLRQRWRMAKRRSNAARVAERSFRGAYPAKKLVPRMTSSFHDDGTIIVVQLCVEWGGIPPQRSWWLVSAEGTCREITTDEANRFRPVPAWR